MRNKNSYFQDLATIAAKQSTCLSKQVGCVFVSKENYVLSIGYNGTPTGMKHCMDKEDGCHRPNGACEDTIHAEQNALIQASVRGISLVGSVVYTTLTPCKACALTLIQLGVSTIYCKDIHSSFKETMLLFEQASIPVYSWERILLNYV